MIFNSKESIIYSENHSRNVGYHVNKLSKNQKLNINEMNEYFMHFINFENTQYIIF
jgi:hypothetical protein